MNLPRPLPFDRHDSVVRVFVVHLAGLGGLTADQTLVFKDQLRQCSIGQISTRPCPALNGGLCNFIIVAHPCIRAIGRCNLLYTAARGPGDSVWISGLREGAVVLAETVAVGLAELCFQ